MRIYILSVYDKGLRLLGLGLGECYIGLIVNGSGEK